MIFNFIRNCKYGRPTPYSGRRKSGRRFVRRAGVNSGHKKTLTSRQAAFRVWLHAEANLVLRSALEGSNDFSFRCSSIVPTVNFNPFAFFQIFVVLEEVGDLGFQQFRQVVHIVDVIVLFAQLGVRTATSLASSPDSSVIFRTPTGRQRITEPGSSGYGVGTSTSTGSPSRDRVWLM